MCGRWSQYFHGLPKVRNRVGCSSTAARRRAARLSIASAAAAVRCAAVSSAVEPPLPVSMGSAMPKPCSLRTNKPAWDSRRVHHAAASTYAIRRNDGTVVANPHRLTPRAHRCTHAARTHARAASEEHAASHIGGVHNAASKHAPRNVLGQQPALRLQAAEARRMSRSSGRARWR